MAHSSAILIFDIPRDTTPPFYQILVIKNKRKIGHESWCGPKCVRFYDATITVTAVIVSKTNQIKNIMPNALRFKNVKINITIIIYSKDTRYITNSQKMFKR